MALRIGIAALFVLMALLVLAERAAAQEPAARQDSAAAQYAADAHGNAGDLTDSEDPVLDRLIAEALRANPGVRAVEARTEGARAQRLEAVLDLAPRITATGGYTRQRLSDATFPDFDGGFSDRDVWEAGTQLVWELDVFGRLRNSLEGRGALVDVASQNVGSARVGLAAEVATEYYRLRGEQERLGVARRNAENQRRTQELTLARLEAGRGTELDSERARAQLSTTLASIPALEASVAASRNRIAVLLGREPGSLEDLPLGEQSEVPDAEPTRTPDAEPAGRRTETTPHEVASVPLPEQLAVPDAASFVPDRHDVRSAARRRAAEAAFVDAAQAAYLPQLSIRGGAGFTAQRFDGLGDSGTFRYGIGAVVSWPLFDLGRAKARVDLAQAREAAARQLYRSTVLEARGEIETALVGYHAARRRLEYLEEAAAATERATGLARLRFKAGATDFLEVLDTERRLLEAQDGLAAGRLDARTAYVRVFRALGGRWPEAGAKSLERTSNPRTRRIR